MVWFLTAHMQLPHELLYICGVAMICVHIFDAMGGDDRKHAYIHVLDVSIDTRRLELSELTHLHMRRR